MNSHKPPLSSSSTSTKPLGGVKQPTFGRYLRDNWRMGALLFGVVTMTLLVTFIDEESRENPHFRKEMRKPAEKKVFTDPWNKNE